MQAERPYRKQGSSVESALVTLGVLVLVLLLLAALHAFPASQRTSLVGAGGGTAIPGEEGLDPLSSEGGGDGSASSSAVGSDDAGAATTSGGGPASKSGAGGAVSGACKGGATDVGVTADSIKLGATVVDSGIGSSFLGSVRVGMAAVQQKVNRAGGICGRTLKLILKDDGWDRERGRTFVKNLVEDEKVFAMAVVPSSEGLDAAADYIDEKGVPVVGTDGMLASQYTKKWIWPVATSTISLMHVIAKDAYDRGARQFSLVYDRKYKFGLEGAYAFNQAVKRMTGADIDGYENPFTSPQCKGRFCGIPAGGSSYNGEARVLTEGCAASSVGGNDACDFNGLLLEPTEALTWYNSGGIKASTLTNSGKGAGAAQPLFTKGFADQCQQACDKLVVWTGFNPPIERFATTPAVQQYVADLRAQSASTDPNNQFLQGGYLGMILLVEGLKQVGPDLTRASLRKVLDSMTLDTGLSQPLTWKSSHFANRSAQGFRINYTSTFSGWSEVTKGWIDDPWVGQDIAH